MTPTHLSQQPGVVPQDTHLRLPFSTGQRLMSLAEFRRRAGLPLVVVRRLIVNKSVHAVPAMDGDVRIAEGELQRIKNILATPFGTLRIFVRSIGPGVITGASDDDPSGIGTYASVGAQYGLHILWMATWLLPMMMAIQETCARIGIVTRHGLAHVIKKRYSQRVVVGIVALLIIANVITIAADLGAMASMLQSLTQLNFYLGALLFAVISVAGVVLIEYRTYASVAAYAEGNYLLRQQQYALQDEKSLMIAKGIVANKLRNCLALVRGEGITHIANKTRMAYKKAMMQKIADATDMASLRGIEGVISRDYFATYFAQIAWYKRVPRGKVDENNILLDMGYNFLFHFTDAILRVYGFDTYKGIYHQLFFQRKSLACDMMEPFRCIIDRALVKMHTLGQFDAKDFGCRQGQYYLSYKASGKYARIFLTEILRYKEDIYHYVRDHYYLILNDEGEVAPFVIR